MAEVLIIDDQTRYSELLRRAIPEHRYRGPYASFSQAKQVLDRSRQRIDLVLLDVHFEVPVSDLIGLPTNPTEADIQQAKDQQGLLMLPKLLRRYPGLPIIIMTCRDELPIHLAKQLGAEDSAFFLENEDIDAQSLRGLMHRVLSSGAQQEAIGPMFFGTSLLMARLRQRLLTLARARLPVILLGQTGTGKSLLARHLLHDASQRRGRFVQVDLATIPSTLMAAHLFGSTKGAFTGSIQDRVGAFEAAHEGTLFLDEIANLTMEAQKLLLTVLQEGKIVRLGDLKERQVDVKVVVATKENLAQLVEEGQFRQDLYMRLSPPTAVTLPPLTDRGLDYKKLVSFCVEQAMSRPYLREMVDEYCERHNLKHSVVVSFAASPSSARHLVLLFPRASQRLLEQHHWPGNLREFSMVVENACLFSLAEAIDTPKGARMDTISVPSRVISELLPATQTFHSVPSPHSLQVAIRKNTTLNKVAQDVERQYFEHLFLQHKGDFAKMAERLLGDEEHRRKVQLRFNQLGLKVRELKDKA